MRRKSPSPPATKEDVRLLLKEYITKRDLRTELKKYATKKDLLAMKQEILDGFRVINENLLYDFRGAFKDRTEQLRDKIDNHEGRLLRLESRAA